MTEPETLNWYVIISTILSLLIIIGIAIDDALHEEEITNSYEPDWRWFIIPIIGWSWPITIPLLLFFGVFYFLPYRIIKQIKDKNNSSL